MVLFNLQSDVVVAP